VPDPPITSDVVSDTTAPDGTSTTDGTNPSDVAQDGTDPTDDVSLDDAHSDAGPGNDTTIGDSDGDGYPDDIDNLPCLAFYLTIYNEGVTAATVNLNGNEVVGSNYFPTPDPITVAINPTNGENTLALGGQLSGSPRDSLTLVVMDSANTLYFATVIVREPGPPRDRSFTFTIDAVCP
jgi:hypothetical protein